MTDASAVAASVSSGEATACDVLAAADAAADRSLRLGAFWCRDRSRERAAAEAVDSGSIVGSLAGVPVAVKDCIDVEGLPTSWGIVGESEPARSDAGIVRRLRAAGSVPFGKTAMDQLAWSVAGGAPGFPRCVNPTAPLLSPGGSSSGSAVAVAAGIVGLGIGTDLAGSVRIPAACCDIVGLKFAPGTVPTEGYESLVPSVDSIGVLARSVRDVRAAYEVFTATRLPPAPGYLRIGVLADVCARAPRRIAVAIERLVQRVERDTIDVVDACLDWRPEGLGRVFSFSLARRWRDAVEERPAFFSSDVRRSVERGSAVTEIEAVATLEALASMRRAVMRRLDGLDVIIAPTLLIDVPRRCEGASVARLTEATRPFSALGWTALALPEAAPTSARPRVSVQLACAPGNEAALFAVADLVEGGR